MVVDNLTQAPFPMAAWTLMIFLGAIQPWLFYDLGLQVWYHATLLSPACETARGRLPSWWEEGMTAQ